MTTTGVCLQTASTIVVGAGVGAGVAEVVRTGLGFVLVVREVRVPPGAGLSSTVVAAPGVAMTTVTSG